MGMEPDIDRLALDRLRALGGEDLIKKMIGLFVSHAEDALKDASRGISAGDFEKIRKAAHSLKSSAGNLGACRLQDIADAMEQLAEKKAEGIQPLMADLENAYLRAKALLARETGEVKPIEDPDR